MYLGVSFLGRPSFGECVALDNWERARGIQCPSCHRETLQLIMGVCPTCARKDEMARDKQLEEKTMRRYYQRQLRKGVISLRALRENLL